MAIQIHNWDKLDNIKIKYNKSIYTIRTIDNLHTNGYGLGLYDERSNAVINAELIINNQPAINLETGIKENHLEYKLYTLVLSHRTKTKQSIKSQLVLNREVVGNYNAFKFVLTCELERLLDYIETKNGTN